MRRPLRRAVLGLVVLPAFALLPGGSSRAVGLQDFSASAASSGVRLLYKNAIDATGTQFDVSAPVTSAVVTSNPDSAGFASAPYPGDDLISLVNTLGPALHVPAQPYPASASSSVPGRSHQASSAPGYALSSTSTSTGSKASATVGPGEAGGATLATSSATSDARRTATGLSATATSSTDSFSAGPLVLSRVRSAATAVVEESGRTKLTSSMEVGDVTVSGQRVGLTRAGLTVAGTDIPLPAGQLTDALSAAGVTVTYLAGTRAPTSVTAPGLLIHYRDDNQDITYVLGRAQAAAAATLETPSVPILPVTDPAGGDLGGSQPPATDSGGQAPVSTLPGPGTDPTGPPPTLDNGQPAPSAPQPVTGVAATTRAADTFDSGVFYLVLVLSAAAAMAVAQLMRYLGVRWASS